MARWEPNARGRLEQAAMELFLERGYPATTVSDIAARAGLTERTFFRYFADKREVLFSGSKDLERAMLDAIVSAPSDAPVLEVVAGALDAAAALLHERRDLQSARARWALVTKHAELQERELIKLAALALALTRALQARGVPEPAASLAAETGMAVFKLGFEHWINGRKPHDLAAHIRAALDTLRTLTAPPKTSRIPAKKPRKRSA